MQNLSHGIPQYLFCALGHRTEHTGILILAASSFRRMSATYFYLHRDWFLHLVCMNSANACWILHELSGLQKEALPYSQCAIQLACYLSRIKHTPLHHFPLTMFFKMAQTCRFLYYLCVTSLLSTQFHKQILPVIYKVFSEL